MNRRERHALMEGRCRTTADGWCATHSTDEGPVFCERDRLNDYAERVTA